MQLGQIVKELENDYSIRYDEQKKNAVIGEYDFQEHKDNQLIVSYRLWKAEDWFEDFEDIIDATPDDVRNVLEHDPDWRVQFN